jgi:ribulose-5-phosphate 4-epimerase/fuculose-1-phosphate aldolase
MRMLITANHILHYHGAVDGFGHISVRHPEKPDVYIMCGYMPPALCKSAEDLIEYYVDGSDTVDPNAAKGYSERYIHGELFKQYPEIQCVVHSHAEPVIPYAVSEVSLVPVYHMSGFLKGKVPVWDIAPLYEDDYRQDMLVNNATFGASLAQAFSSSASQHSGSLTERERVAAAPDYNVVLMKRHGYTTHGKDIPTAVYRAIYTLINAGVQTNAMTISSAQYSPDQAEAVAALELKPRHTHDCQIMTEATQDKAWRLWCREVEVNPIYQNEL